MNQINLLSRLLRQKSTLKVRFWTTRSVTSDISPASARGRWRRPDGHKTGSKGETPFRPERPDVVRLASCPRT